MGIAIGEHAPDGEPHRGALWGAAPRISIAIASNAFAIHCAASGGASMRNPPDSVRSMRTPAIIAVAGEGAPTGVTPERVFDGTTDVVDVDGAGLAEPVDAPDPLLEHRRVPRHLEGDASARGALQVEAHAARVAEEHHADVRVVVEVDDCARALRGPLRAGEEDCATALLGEKVAHAP